MYKFKMTDGTEANIYFAHKGGKKGASAENSALGQDIPGKPPRFTMCSIINEKGVKLATGIASPVRDMVELIASDTPRDSLQTIYGKRFIRLIRTTDGKSAVLLRGDRFSRAKGREKSLSRALKELPREDRDAAWNALKEATSN